MSSRTPEHSPPNVQSVGYGPLADRRRRWWKAAARGFRVELGDGAGAEARVLGDRLVETARRQLDTWQPDTRQPETEPRLEQWSLARSSAQRSVERRSGRLPAYIGRSWIARASMAPQVGKTD